MVISGKSVASNRPKLVVLGAVAALAIGTVGVVQVTSRGSGNDKLVLSGAGTKLLQSVDVTTRPDAAITRIQTTSVVSTDKSGETQTATKDLKPDEVAGQLPARVLTSYRTAKGTGTNLADLEGYTGRVEIDLSVQNLTVKPTVVNYDVDGASKQATALVGAPLTVVAATALDGVKPGSVVTDGQGTEAVTNGVLSQSDKGDAQIQWATILAPPQLGSTAKLSLVLDADHLKVPEFNLTVQPGLVTDPSIGGVINNAFNPADSNELALQSRTIKLIGDVNGVLSRASATIAKVRDTLKSSSATLGTKTVADLQSSATSVASSTKDLSASVTSLGQDIGSTLKGTQSQTLSQLAQTVQAMNTLIGDTSVRTAPVRITGDGCDTTVAAPEKAGSVYANILEVVGQLDGYADANVACKERLQAAILDAVGPADPSAATCTTSSVTCSLYEAQTSFNAVATQLVTAGSTAVAAMQPEKLDAALAAGAAFDTAMTTITSLLAPLTQGSDLTEVKRSARDLRSDIGNARNRLDDFAAALTTVHQQAVAGSDQATSIVDQNSELATKLCGLIGDGTNGTLTADQVEQVRAYVSSTTCPDVAGNTSSQSAPGKWSAPLDQRLADQSDAWSQIAASTDTSDATQGLGKVLAQADLAMDTLDAQMTDLDQKISDAAGGTGTNVGTLRTAVRDLTAARDTMLSNLGDLQQQQTAIKTAIQEAFQTASADALGQLATEIDPQIRVVRETAEANSASLGDLFAKSTIGLSAAADQIRSDSASTLETQKRVFATQQGKFAQEISKNVASGLQTINTSVSSSTKDMAGASALLTRDLHSVLLDLGTRAVRGGGLLGAMATSSATANSANYQLALATGTSTSYANVRGRDIAGIMLRQAQTDAALEKQSMLPAFALKTPAGLSHRTVYTFHIRNGA